MLHAIMQYVYCALYVLLSIIKNRGMELNQYYTSIKTDICV